jgi:hypothetical protein
MVVLHDESGSEILRQQLYLDGRLLYCGRKLLCEFVWLRGLSDIGTRTVFHVICGP